MNQMKKILALLLAVVLVGSLFAGCGNSTPASSAPPASEAEEPAKAPDTGSEEADDAEEDAPEVEKELTMYIGVVEQQALIIAQRFEQDTGIKVNFVRMSGGEILSRIRAEQENPQASIWYGGPVDSFIAAKDEGLLQPYHSPVSDTFDPAFVDPDGYWTGIYLEYMGFIGDTRFLAETGAEMPTSWDDLLKPEFTGQIMVANPGSSSTGYTMVSTLVQMRGEEEAMEYFKQLNNQVKQYTKAGEAPATSTALGECGIGIIFLHGGLRLMDEGFDNLVLSAPQEGTGYGIGSVGMIEGAPEPEAAKVFIDWCLTPEVQEIAQQNGSYQFLTNPAAKTPEQAASIADTPLIDYDFVWSGENKSRLVDAWTEAVQE